MLRFPLRSPIWASLVFSRLGNARSFEARKIGAAVSGLVFEPLSWGIRHDP